MPMYPLPALTRKKVSHAPGQVAAERMASVVCPPPPTAVRKLPVLNVWMVQVDGTGSGKGNVADAGWLMVTTAVAASTRAPARLRARLRFMCFLPGTVGSHRGAPPPDGVPRRT